MDYYSKVQSLEERRKTLQTTQSIMEPCKYDILCGKDKECLSHYGSRRFRSVIEAHRDEYQQATTKQEKMNITRKIVATLNRLSCRFLKYNDELQCWQEISHVAARDKVSHALRFANRKSTTKVSITKQEPQKCSSRHEEYQITSSFGELKSIGMLSDFEPTPIGVDASEFTKQGMDERYYEPTPILEVVNEFDPIPVLINEPKLDLSWIVKEPLMKQYLLGFWLQRVCSTRKYQFT